MFDEQRLVSDAGLLLTATLDESEGGGRVELVNESVWLGYRVPGAALPGRKVMSLVHGMLAGADSIDDMNVLRAGSTGLVLGHRVMAPSTCWNVSAGVHVRSTSASSTYVLDIAIARAWGRGRRPQRAAALVIDIDSFIGEVHGEHKQGASYGYTRQLGYHPIAAVRSDTGEVLHIRNRKGSAAPRGAEGTRFVDELPPASAAPGTRARSSSGPTFGREPQGSRPSTSKASSSSIKRQAEQASPGADQPDPRARSGPHEDYPDTGEAQIAETKLKGWRLIVRRTRLVGAQAELFPDWRHHCFATNRTVPTLIADIDHRDHATIELVIRDLKDQALRHFPSGQFHANSAWTVIAALAHNIGRWATQIGLPDRPVQTARARRRHLLAIPARLTRSSRIWTLRMPARWPCRSTSPPTCSTRSASSALLALT